MFTFQFLNDKSHNYVRKKIIVIDFIIQKLKIKDNSDKKIYKLRKTNTFFSRFKGTRGEKTQIFCTKVRLYIAIAMSQSEGSSKQLLYKAGLWDPRFRTS